MFCTKCGANNEDNNVFCKKCGARLAKPVTNSADDTVIDNRSISNNSVSGSQSTANSSGVVKSVNIKLIAGLAAAVIVVVVAVGILMNVGKGGKTLFEQVELGKTSLVDVEKYFGKNNLGSTWGKENTMYAIDDGIWLEVPDWDATGWDFKRVNLYDGLYDYLFEEFLIHNDLSDTLWGANCDYFLAMSDNNDKKDNDRKVLFMACVVEVDGNAEEREFRQNLNKYLKKHQKTKLKNQIYNNVDDEMDYVFYPLEITTMNGEKVLICLNCNYNFLSDGFTSDGVIFLALYAEPYYTEEDLEIIMKKNVPDSDQLYPDSDYLFWDWDDYMLFNGKTIGWYFNLTLTEMYPEFYKKEQDAIEKEAPDFICSFSTFYDENVENKCIRIDSCISPNSDVVIPETIHGYPVKEIKDGTFSGCSSLTSVTLPNGITRIGSKTFANCINLTSINIPDSVIEIADDAFDDCNKLVSDELISRFPNAAPKSAWLEAYRKFAEENIADAGFCFFGYNNVGIPALAISQKGFCYYDGIEVNKYPYNWEWDGDQQYIIKYNADTNKALVNYDFYAETEAQASSHCYLIDLYTNSTELLCIKHIDFESNITTYDNTLAASLGISEEEYNSIMDEMNKRFGEGGYYLETWYSSVDEAYQAYISNEPNTSASSETPAADVQIPAPAETAPAADTALDTNMSIDVEAEVALIREWYYDTQNRLDTLMYSEYGTDLGYYFELGYAVKGVIPAGYNDWDYTRQYFYHDQQLYFAFVFKDSEEYRIYFKDGKVIRYIDNNGTVYDYENIGDGEQLGQKVIAESDKLYPEFNCGN